jgi:hypothetical protein
MARTDGPRYRLLADFFADNHTRYPEGAELVWLGTPNEHMEPLNAAAEEKITDFLADLDRMGEIKARLEGKMFTHRHPDMADVVAEAIGDRPKEPRTIQRRSEAPIRPDLLSKADQRREAAKPRNIQVDSVKMPEQPGKMSNVQPVPILGTTYTADAARDAR